MKLSILDKHWIWATFRQYKRCERMRGSKKLIKIDKTPLVKIYQYVIFNIELLLKREVPAPTSTSQNPQDDANHPILPSHKGV